MSAARHPASWAAGTMVLAVLGLAGTHAHAQSAVANNLLPTQNPCTSCAAPLPEAGGPASQSLPAAPVPTQQAFRLNDLRLNGVKALRDAELSAITGPYVGRDVTLADLEAMTQAITAQYRERGYFLATAVVPVQTVQNGVVEISVIEGRLGNITVNVAPDAPLGEARVRGFLSALQTGDAVTTGTYERALLLLSDQPGVRVSSNLQEGAQPGTTDLTVDVVAARPWQASIDADNHGTVESGRYRVGATGRWLSPFGIGDNLDARAMISNGSDLVLGRVSYEAPLGTGGLRGGIGLSRVQYDLAGDFKALDAHGTADVVDVSLNYPLIRSRGQNLFLRLGADSQDLTDDYEAIGFSSKKRVRGLGLGWSWERRDQAFGGGYWASAGTFYHGELDIRDAVTAQFDQQPGGPHTEGDFNKLTFQFSRLQTVLPSHSLYLSLGGQWADRNLDASQKLSLGGARAVRAYASSEALVDEGLIGVVEWRWSYSETLTPFVFYDAAHGKPAHDPSPLNPSDNAISLRGAGFGVSWAQPGNFSVNATLAWRAGTRPALADGGGHNPRLYVQLQKVF